MSADRGDDPARVYEDISLPALKRWEALRASLLESLPASSSPNGDLEIEVRFEDGAAKTVSVGHTHTLGLDFLEFRCDVCRAERLGMDAALAANAALAFPGLALSEGRYLLRYAALAESLDAPSVILIVRTLASSADIIARPSPTLD